jgi:hypothetical protein
MILISQFVFESIYELELVEDDEAQSLIENYVRDVIGDGVNGMGFSMVRFSNGNPVSVRYFILDVVCGSWVWTDEDFGIGDLSPVGTWKKFRVGECIPS